MNWTLIAAVNNDAVLNSCLLNSPDAATATDVLLQRGFASAATAYNAGLAQAQTDVVVLAHQDVYFPEGWIGALEKAVTQLEATDPHWAVLGVWGIPRAAEPVGHLYCAGLQRTLGDPFAAPVPVQSLDELVLIVRKSSGVRFDERLGGYHFYGTDICLEANRRGLQAYAISAFCLHNTNGYDWLPLAFWRAYWFMRKKWRAELPITTSCTTISFWGWPMIRWNVVRGINLLLRRHRPGRRVPDPIRLYHDLSETRL